MVSRWIKNTSGGDKTWVGQLLTDGEYYQIQDVELNSWQTNSALLSDIGSGDAVVAKDDSGSQDLTDVNTAIDFLKGNLTSTVEVSPFASKKIADKSIFKRAVGKRYSLSSGTNTLTYTIDFVSCKMTGLELIGGEVGDYVDLKILDTAAGTVSGIPNYMLNQFGFEVNIAAGHHREDSNYDADLFVGLQVQVTYESVSAKDIGINYILHEVK